jgi:hypothetical protein
MSTVKYLKLCMDVCDKNEIGNIILYQNYLYRIQLKEIYSPIDIYRGEYGYFYEYDLNEIKDLKKYIISKCQTLTYCGFDIRSFKENILFIDRIVPVGSSLDIDIIWDGYNLIERLSTICDIR